MHLYNLTIKQLKTCSKTHSNQFFWMMEVIVLTQKHDLKEKLDKSNTPNFKS